MASKKTLGGLAVVAGLVAWAVSSAPRELPEAAPAPVEPVEPVQPPAPPVRASFRRRLATSLALTVVFFGGAALAAGAGNVLVANDGAAPAAETTTTDVTTDVTTTDTVTDATTTEDVATTTAEAPPATTEDVTTTAEVETNDALVPARAPLPAPLPTPAPAPRAVVRAQRHVAAPAPAPAPAPVAPAVVSPFPVVRFDPQAWLADNPGTAAGNAAVALAEHYLGVPYRWGGAAPSTGFDCSGLTQFVYAQLGVWLPHYAAAQFLAYPRIDPSQLAPGDLVFFEPKADGPGHVAIYAGDGQIVEAPHTGATVRVGSLAGAATALGFLGAVRPTAAHVERALAALQPEPASGTWFVAA